MGQRLYSAKFSLPDGSHEPDKIIADSSSNVQNFVVSRGKDGQPISYYEDLSWDFSSYHPRGQNSVISFAYWKDVPPSKLMLIAEAKFILRNIIWLKQGRMLSIEVLVKYGHTVRAMTKYADSKGGSIGRILSSSEELAAYFLEMGVTYVKQILSIIRILRVIGSHRHGLSLLSEDEEVVFVSIKDAADERIRQHPPIPSRIYFNIIDGLVRDLEEYCQYKMEHLTVLGGAMNSSCYARTPPKKNHKGYTTFFEATTPELRAYLNKYGHSLRVQGLASCVTRIQILCKTLIHAFSGMRDDETCFLPFDCVERRVVEGQIYYLIHGVTTKGGTKATFWVTSQIAIKAIEVAQEISELIYNNRDVKIRKSGEFRDPLFPLFIGSSEFFRPRSTEKSYAREFVVGALDICDHRDVFKRYSIEILDEDLEELEFVDPHRAWREEGEFKVGNDWPLKTHQFRRSLALYGTNSGFIGVSSMRQQFQQVRNSMAEYYCRGSVYARDLLTDDPNHMCGTYQSTLSESEALGFLKNLLLSNEKHVGAYAVWVDRNLHEIGTPISLEKRDYILKKFKNGEMSYRETYLGGCSKIGPCDKAAMRSIFSCVKNCSSASIKPSKLDRAIALHQVFLEKLDPESIEWKAEKEAHDDLCHFKINNVAGQ